MRKAIFLLTIILMGSLSFAQRKTENIVIVTMDGLRWQEVFAGMDSALANNLEFHEGDSQYIFDNYWHNDPDERRKKLLPFFWGTIQNEGQLLGNRNLGSMVNTANPHWFSFPGYSELFTGYADTAINRNSYPANPHVNVFEFLNSQKKLKGKVAAFGAWNAFDRILNEERGGFPVINAFDTVAGNELTSNQRLINKMLLNSYRPWGPDECLDVFTHYAAFEYLKTKRPKVLYIAYGETDEWAHSGKYRSYLDAAKQTDQWINELWKHLQSDPQYRNKTTLLITTDHGRGDVVKREWTSHGKDFRGSGEIWIAGIGPDSPVRGEIGQPMQVYQEQFAQTITKLMGYTFKANHQIANEILYFF